MQDAHSDIMVYYICRLRHIINNTIFYEKRKRLKERKYTHTHKHVHLKQKKTCKIFLKNRITNKTKLKKN